MKFFCLLLITGIFTISLHAQKTQQNISYLKSAEKQLRTGITLTATGFGVTAVGYVMAASGNNFYKSGSVHGEDASVAFMEFGGMFIALQGVVLTMVGVPNIIIGGIKKGHASRNIQLGMVQFISPNNHASINGIGLTIRF
jgi:hypothetical protein